MPCASRKLRASSRMLLRLEKVRSTAGWSEAGALRSTTCQCVSPSPCRVTIARDEGRVAASGRSGCWRGTRGTVPRTAMHSLDFPGSFFSARRQSQCSKCSALCVKGAQRATAQEVRFALRGTGRMKGRMPLSGSRTCALPRFASLTRACALLVCLCREQHASCQLYLFPPNPSYGSHAPTCRIWRNTNTACLNATSDDPRHALPHSSYFLPSPSHAASAPMKKSRQTFLSAFLQ
jgi:hypothetical protein